MESEVADVEAVIEQNNQKPKPLYRFPPISLLKKGNAATAIPIVICVRRL